MEVDKQNGKICYNDSAHVYWNEDTQNKYISVTTLIHNYTQPFDKEFWSAYKAIEKLLDSESWKIAKKELLATKKVTEEFKNSYEIQELDFNKTQQEILDTWQEENFKSCERGTKIHAELENSMYNMGANVSLKKFGVGGKFICDKGRTNLDLENGVYPEYLISRESSDGILRIAGQIDLLVKNGNEITIMDWKGLPLDTEIPTLEGWSTIAELKEGDTIFDKDGKPTKIVHKSEVHNNPCYKITFDNGDSIVADHEHRWLVAVDGKSVVKTTEELKELSSPKIHIAKPIKSNSFNYNLVSAIISDKTEGYYSYKATDFSNFEAVQNAIAITGIKSWLNKEELTIGFYVEDFLLVMDRQEDKITPERQYRTIISIESTETVPTQCLEVDSPTHTFLCTTQCIVTHNTNKKIDIKSYFDSKAKSTAKMQYPLNNLDDSNYWHYTMQLSTYAWMVEKLNPDFVIKDLILVHFDHNDNQTVYHLNYLKNEVERMLKHYKKEIIKQQQRDKRKPIVY